jgi:16S rRNA (cytosine1402-N4)-methyltransferase
VEDNAKPVRLTVVASNYSKLKSVLLQQGLYGKVDGLLADLGLSSMQIDDPSRGFSFKNDGPLDLRMNPLVGAPASQILAEISEMELARILEEYSDEPRAKWCAQAILKKQKQAPILTTKDLESCVRLWLKTLSAGTQAKEGDIPIRRVFQALRIIVNEEFESLERFLEDLPLALKKNGRVAILSFHSGEDRRVKKAFQAGLRSGLYSEISDEIMRPSFEEQRENTRSKSAKLRTAMRA